MEKMAPHYKYFLKWWFLKKYRKIHLSSYFSDYHHYLYLLLLSSLKRKVRILTVFLLVALTLGKNGKVNTLKICTDFAYASRREFVCWLAQFLTKKNGLLLHYLHKDALFTEQTKKWRNLCLKEINIQPDNILSINLLTDECAAY